MECCVCRKSIQSNPIRVGHREVNRYEGIMFLLGDMRCVAGMVAIVRSTQCIQRKGIE